MFPPTQPHVNCLHLVAELRRAVLFDSSDSQSRLGLQGLQGPVKKGLVCVVQPGVADYRVVLDAEGNNAGFATYVEKLFAMAENMGLKASFSTHINSIAQAGKGFELKTATNTVCR